MNANKEKALAAMAEEKTITAAAKKAGLSRPTLYEYLGDKDFRKALKRQREAAAMEQAELLARHRQEAIDTIIDVMLSCTQPGQTRINAAWKLLQAEAEARQAVEAILQSKDSTAYWLDRG